MNPSWLQQMQKSKQNGLADFQGMKVRILSCAHVDVKRFQEGVIVGYFEDPRGFKVEVTGIFAKDIQNLQQETRTETVFVETNQVEFI